MGDAKEILLIHADDSKSADLKLRRCYYSGGKISRVSEYVRWVFAAGTSLLHRMLI
jgi:hypothetical protein